MGTRISHFVISKNRYEFPIILWNQFQEIIRCFTKILCEEINIFSNLQDKMKHCTTVIYSHKWFWNSAISIILKRTSISSHYYFWIFCTLSTWGYYNYERDWDTQIVFRYPTFYLWTDKNQEIFIDIWICNERKHKCSQNLKLKHELIMLSAILSIRITSEF